MPTTPVETVLNRDISKAVAQPFIDRFCPVLDEIVNYGTNLYKRATYRMTDLLTADGVPILIYANVLEMTDAISVMLRESSVTPAIPVVRASYESTLAYEYIFESDTTNRSHAWLVAYLLEQIDWADKILGTGKSGQQFHAALKDDSVGANIDLAPFVPIATKQKAEFQDILDKPEFAAAVAERNRLLKKNPFPHWYTSFGGPTNLRQLAERLKREAQYIVLYKQFSAISHGQNLARFVKRAASKDPLVRLLRDPGDFTQVAMFAITFAVRCTRLLSNRLNEDQHVNQWYIQEIQPGFMGADAATSTR